MEASATLRFCDDAVCAIALSVAAPSAWMSAFVKFDKILKSKYGEPVGATGELPGGCRNETAFEHCVMATGLKFVREWRWDSGERIVLKLGPGDGAPDLEVVYIRRPQHTVAPDAL
jgi:hypothetical protein